MTLVPAVNSLPSRLGLGGDPDPGGLLGFQVCWGWEGGCGQKSLFSIIESLSSLEDQRMHWVLEGAKRREGGDAGPLGGPSVSCKGSQPSQISSAEKVNLGEFGVEGELQNVGEGWDIVDLGRCTLGIPSFQQPSPSGNANREEFLMGPPGLGTVGDGFQREVGGWGGRL